MILAGCAKKEITPQLPCELGGYASRTEPAKEIVTPLYAKALALKNEEQIWLLISLDLVGVSREMAETLRSGLSKTYWGETGAEKKGKEKINISVIATHTHCAPNGLPGELDYGLWTEERNHVPQEYCDKVMEAAQTAASKALSSFREVRARWRVADAKGLYSNRRDAALPTDTRVHLLELETPDGENVGGMVHLGCHPTIVDALAYHVTYDMAGYLCSALEKGRDKAIFLFANGAAGDVSTRYTRRAATEEEAEYVGTEIAKRLETASVLIEGENLSFEEQTQNYIDRYTGTEIPVLYQSVNAAGMRLFFSPGEMYTSYALKLAEHSDKELIVGYANGYLGYIPDAASGKEAGYEAEVCRLSHQDLEKIEQTIDRFAKECI